MCRRQRGRARYGGMTATRIICVEEIALVVARELHEVQESFYEALANGGWVHIEADDGKQVAVNPSLVVYLEGVELPDPSAADP